MIKIDALKEIAMAMVLTCLIFMAIILFIGCMSMPDVDDYPADMYPCYMADKCVSVNGFARANVQDCTLAIQKCFRYSDRKACKDDKDPEQCFKDLGIRI